LNIAALFYVKAFNFFTSSEEGGTEIEEVAAKTPEKIFKETIDPVVGLAPY
jgi:succinyl-CoA synthetase beta subunit